MAKNGMEIEPEPIRVGADGEILRGKFCAYCGELNDHDASKCEHCREIILDQGPDLASRLARIRRHAANIGSKNAQVEHQDRRRHTVPNPIPALMARYQQFSHTWAGVVFNILALSLEVLILYILVKYVLLPTF